MKRSPMARGTSRLKRTEFPKPVLVAACYPLTPTKRRLKQAAHRLWRIPRDEDQAWSKGVRERDGDRCQWQSCGFCGNVPLPSNDAHHKALRSARPDLRHVLSNGVTVCRRRHEWIHGPGRQEAVATGFLDLTTYEAAAKERMRGTREATNQE